MFNGINSPDAYDVGAPIVTEDFVLHVMVARKDTGDGCATLYRMPGFSLGETPLACVEWQLCEDGLQPHLIISALTGTGMMGFVRYIRLQ